MRFGNDCVYIKDSRYIKLVAMICLGTVSYTIVSILVDIYFPTTFSHPTLSERFLKFLIFIISIKIIKKRQL